MEHNTERNEQFYTELDALTADEIVAGKQPTTKPCECVDCSEEIHNIITESVTQIYKLGIS